MSFLNPHSATVCGCETLVDHVHSYCNVMNKDTNPASFVCTRHLDILLSNAVTF